MPQKQDAPAPKAPSPRERAKEEFAATVRTWGHWATWLLLIVGIAALVLSFMPVGNVLGISKPEAVLTMGLSAGTPLVQYMLQAWGVIAVEVASLISLAGLATAAAVLSFGWIRKQRANRKRRRA